MHKISKMMFLSLGLALGAGALVSSSSRGHTLTRLVSSTDRQPAAIDLVDESLHEAQDYLNALNLDAQSAFNKVKLMKVQRVIKDALIETDLKNKKELVSQGAQALVDLETGDLDAETAQLVAEGQDVIAGALKQLQQQVDELTQAEGTQDAEARAAAEEARLRAEEDQRRADEERARKEEERRRRGDAVGGFLRDAIGIGLGIHREHEAREEDERVRKERERYERENPSQSRSLSCASEKERHIECGTDIYLEEATVTRQISRTACVQGQNFGIQGRSLVVWGGCRAEFKVFGRAKAFNP